MRALIPLVLALAGCGQPAETGNAATANAAQSVGYSGLQQRVLDLTPPQRDGVLLRAIRDGNAPCQGVTAAERQPDQDGAPLYVARCSDGPIYAIGISRDGIAQVARVSGERR